MKIRLSGRSDKGCVREINEDMILVGISPVRDSEINEEKEISAEGRYCVLVSDGMGGHDNGEVASEHALIQIRSAVMNRNEAWEIPEEVFARTIERIGAELNAMSAEKALNRSMGCTLSGIVFLDGKIHLLNVGDSRSYRFRDGILRQMSIDQTLHERDGVEFPQGKALYSCIGANCEAQLECEEISGRIIDGDRFLICSDGLTDMVSENDIEAILSNGNAEEAAETLVEKAKAEGGKSISGADAFKLYDTFGFPVDLTREIAEESKLAIDEDTFNALMTRQKNRAREARANISGWSSTSKSLISELDKTEFTGYTDYRSEAKILAILVGDDAVDSVNEGDCTIILDRTPFYGEGGGQIGDAGTIYAEGKLINVYDTKKSDGVYIHLCTVINGTFSVGESVMADINDTRRRSIARNHSAAHLLQAALRKVLGNHVEQAGSYVSNTVCRFDFSHFQPLTKKEIAAVELFVNSCILSALKIEMGETDVETAKANGAIALFGEKYGKVVRMVKMGTFSTELCGGTHCSNTGEIGLFKIISESSVAAGVRRIEAVTGAGLLDLLNEKDALIADVARELKCQNPADIGTKAAALSAELASARREIDSLNSKLAATKLDSILANTKQIGSVKLAAVRFDGMAIEVARSLADEIKANHPDTVAVIAVNGEKLNFIAVCGADAAKAGAHAGKLVSAVAAVTGGKGGGRPDNAMAGGADASKIDEALALAQATLAGMLK